ncbi:MAG: class A beta-lactamase-related serine hydrolase [Phenylobacterium sp.]|uniref:serine hydrolase domain-containing protein n=1 Tax=Phenylobacterium sp. TaxID=1871053 RepID=UPI0011FC4FA3|nr:serine hydrolase domain-containing protein [Phenylobacterium sp.]TAJ71864.1 MAG: class A beta-lactamase-related serine hydrolase [Phenylobacterium sp.]
MAAQGITIHGTCAPQFAEVRAEFERNFTDRGELGASVAICLDGAPVVDLWAGQADEGGECPWEEDTLAVVFSTSKGLAAMCLHVLADRGAVDFDAPVAKYWPQFAANGKAGVTVGMVMSHQAGLPFWMEPLPDGALLDWEPPTEMLARSTPIWEPGTAHGYHAMTLGNLEGEIVRRVTGMSLGRFFRQEVAEPLGADAWFGLPPSEEPRVATLYLPDASPNSPMGKKLEVEPDWVGHMLWNNGGDTAPAMINSVERHAAEIPAAGAITNARALARLYAPLSRDGSVDGVKLVSPQALPYMRRVRSASGCDTVLRIPTAFTLGFSKSWGDRRLGPGEHVIIGEQAFGTPGFGGSIGFADGEAKMSFGYVMNRLGGGVGLNDRAQSMIDAAYRACGYRDSAPGMWVR